MKDNTIRDFPYFLIELLFNLSLSYQKDQRIEEVLGMIFE